MTMSKGRINDFYTQYEELMNKFEKQEKMIKIVLIQVNHQVPMDLKK